MSKHLVEPGKVIELLGGNAKTAALCEVTPGAVSQWLHNGIPRTQLKYLRAVRPDVFGEAPAKRKRQRTPAPPP
ncbi:hypothetical protein EJB06_07510 [Massilia atriviolacea]|uniref:Rha family transcriptional regulator n=1 Tax=Massilia atriviolacea TaxID=2495579 RepID=A0A430HR70_9BURK|nr:hypothetical protein EJB06_07510 [Massilia atriviolacea]